MFRTDVSSSFHIKLMLSKYHVLTNFENRKEMCLVGMTKKRYTMVINVKLLEKITNDGDVERDDYQCDFVTDKILPTK